MHPSKKFTFDVSITLLASVINVPLGFIIQTSRSLKSLAEFFEKTFLKRFRRYLGAGDLGLYRMTSTIYGIAMLVAVIGIPAAMIKYVAEFKDDIIKFNLILPQISNHLSKSKHRGADSFKPALGDSF